MSITKYQEINLADLQAVINSLNTEITRRGLNTVTAPTAGTVIDDTILDTLANKIIEVRGSHCYCQTNSSVTHSGCPAYVNPSLQSSQVNEGVLIVASESSLPDVLDIQTDLNKLTTTTACSPQCKCNTYCSCYHVSNLHCSCESQCDCNKACSCEDACNCEDACGSVGNTPPCTSESTCKCESVCNCVGHCSCNLFMA